MRERWRIVQSGKEKVRNGLGTMNPLAKRIRCGAIENGNCHVVMAGWQGRARVVGGAMSCEAYRFAETPA